VLNMSSVTITNQNLQREGPVLSAVISIANQLEKKYAEQKLRVPEAIELKALIDTGASHSVVQEDIPKKLGLEPIGETRVNTPTCSDHICYKYFLRMIIPVQNNSIYYEGVFTALPLKGQNIDCLMGRDMLKDGVLVYSGCTNQFTLSI